MTESQSPLDTLIAAVQCDRRADFSDSIARRDAALRATCEQVLADLTMADAEIVEAVGTLRRQRATLESELLHQRVYVQGRDVLIAHLEQKLVTAETERAGWEHAAVNWQHQADSNPQSWRRGYAAGWAAGHEPAACGHARANRKDPMFGTQEYEGNEHCEVCELIADLPCRRCQHWPCNCEQGPLVRAPHGKQP